MSNLQTTVDTLIRRLTSGNHVAVTRATITAEEFAHVLNALDQLTAVERYMSWQAGIGEHPQQLLLDEVRALLGITQDD